MSNLKAFPTSRDPCAAIPDLPPHLRDALRRVLVMDQTDRDSVAAELLRFHNGADDTFAQVIDLLRLYPDERRKVVWAPGGD